MATAAKLIREYMSFSNDPEMRLIWNFTDAKRAKREAIEQVLETLVQVDPAVREANRAIFSSILKFYSRDTYTIGGN
jgi:predicted nucleic-acid-binding protein